MRLFSQYLAHSWRNVSAQYLVSMVDYFVRISRALRIPCQSNISLVSRTLIGFGISCILRIVPNRKEYFCLVISYMFFHISMKYDAQLPVHIFLSFPLQLLFIR